MTVAGLSYVELVGVLGLTLAGLGIIGAGPFRGIHAGAGAALIIGATGGPGWASLALAGAFLTWVVHAWWYPFVDCWHCGNGKKGSGGRAYKLCGWCKGKPRKIRPARRLVSLTTARYREARKAVAK